MNTYLLSYEPMNLRVSATQVGGYIKDNRHVSAWYSPFSGTWIIKSEQPLFILLASFSNLFDGVSYILTQISTPLIGGALPGEIWHWMNTGELPQPQPSLLSNLFSGNSPFNPGA